MIEVFFRASKVRLYVCSWIFERGYGYKMARGVSFSCGAWLSARPPTRGGGGGEDERNARSCATLAAPQVINAFGQRGKGQTRARNSLFFSVLPARAPSRFSPFHLLGNLSRASTWVSLEKKGRLLVCVYDLIPGRSYVTLERTAPPRPFEATKERQKKLRRQRDKWTISVRQTPSNWAREGDKCRFNWRYFFLTIFQLLRVIYCKNDIFCLFSFPFF